MDDPRLVKMFKALSNPNRYRLFDEIRKSGGSSFEEGHTCFLNTIIDKLSIGAPTVSHHLKELVNAGLVVTEKDGKFVQCRIDVGGVALLKEFVESMD
jgi:DNA-binding transcriptional ArsR family regulator